MNAKLVSSAQGPEGGYLEQDASVDVDAGAEVIDSHEECSNAFPGFLAILRQGIGLATDLYDLSIVNAIRPQFEDSYGKLSVWENGAITSASHLGAMFGQLLFGYLADRLGRRGTFISTAAIMFFAAAGTATISPLGNLTAAQLMMILRFFLGVGIGGEYPLSGAVTAEDAPVQHSATHMATLTLCFLVGQVLAPLVVLACLYSGVSSQMTWRIGIGGGAVLALIGFLVRLKTMQESKSWLESRAATQRQSIFQDRSTFQAIWRPLAGTFFAWLVYDVLSYGTGAYTTTLFQASTRTGTIWNVLLIVALSAPGYFFTLCVGRFGRKQFQMAGFLGMGIAFSSHEPDLWPCASICRRSDIWCAEKL